MESLEPEVRDVEHRLRAAIDLQDTTIDVDDSIAKVMVRAILAGTFDGNICDGTYRYTRTWRKDCGRWQVIAGSMSPEPNR
jgi:ketosteroid isomerase-like protein